MPVIVPDIFSTPTPITGPIPITEPWTRHNWNYFTTDLASTNGVSMGWTGNLDFPWGLDTQQHVDLASFTESGWQITNGALVGGYQASYNHWPGGALACTGGVTTTAELLFDPVDFTEFWGDGLIALALPGLPLGDINPNECFLDFSSDGFNEVVGTLPWEDSEFPIVVGNTALVWTLDQLSGPDLTQINAVRIRVAATSTCTVTLMALRLMDDGWVQSNIDFDNNLQQLHQCIPLSGDPNEAILPASLMIPPLWRCNFTPGTDDPQPINSEISFLFNTGSQTSSNSCTIYMRQVNDQVIRQADLQGVTQSSLTGLPQPAGGESASYSSWISFTVSWGDTIKIQITDNSGVIGYTYTSGFVFTNNTTYLCICNLTETNARLQIYDVNQTTLAIPTYPMFDTTVIPDTYMFPRRAGRIGFQAALNDGDSWIGAVRPRHLMFAEYRSRPMTSITPVKGAQLYVAASPDIELFTGWTELSDGTNTPAVTIDQQRYLQADTKKVSTRVTVNTPSTALPSQGVISNILSPSTDAISGITDFNEFHIMLSLWLSSVALNSTTLGGEPPITVSLISSAGNVIPIEIPALRANQWSNISIFRPITRPYPESGLYQITLNYNGTVPATWWVGGVSFHEHSLDWAARSVVSDPWNSNFAPWTTFHDLINSDSDGVRLYPVGNDLQVRGQALWQNAMVLSQPKIVPRYGELGRLAWPEDAPPSTAPPTPVINTSNTGRNWTFNGSSSTSPVGVGNYLWAFGDGNFGSGPVATHTYSSSIPSGTQYQATLMVMDKLGQLNAIETTVTMT